MLGVAIMAAVPVGVAAWPERSEDLPAVEPIRVLAQQQRDPSISRSLRERTPLPLVTTPSATATTAAPTPTPKPTATPTPEPTVSGHLYVTAALNVRTGPSRDAAVLTVLARGTQVGVTDVTDGSWMQIIQDDEVAWVNGEYLSETEPPEETPDSGGGISSAECESGSAVEAGLTPDAIRVHRAVCAEFPSVTSYGGVRSGGGEHSAGRALDIMVSSSSLGDAIAAFARANYQELGISEVIWSQQIWTVERASDGWRWMEDRGSATANHYDHVHVTVYGYSGG
ncbi:MAG TPA: SH3 domain-containing protein [Jiangellaceae bacterium]|nr:SH3 domain-containing protein [Jiangellaceae bacterium]